jgi:outer membrane protein
VKFRSILLPLALAAGAAAQTAPTVAAKPADAPAPAPAPVGTPAKVAILHFQQAVLSTREGQQIAATLKAKYDPRRTQLEKRQADLTALQQKLQGGAATLTEAQRAKMQNDLTNGGRTLNHDIDDLNAELQEEEGKAMQSMAGKMGDLIKSYATQNGFAVVLDVSAENTPVLWAAQSSNITADIVKLYDEAHPAAAPAPAPAAKK